MTDYESRALAELVRIRFRVGVCALIMAAPIVLAAGMLFLFLLGFAAGGVR